MTCLSVDYTSRLVFLGTSEPLLGISMPLGRMPISPGLLGDFFFSLSVEYQSLPVLLGENFISRSDAKIWVECLSLSRSNAKTY